MKILKILFVLCTLLTLTSCAKINIQTNITPKIEQEQATETLINKPAIIPNNTNNLILSMRMPKTFNPLINEDSTVDNILKLVFEPLFTIDSKTLEPIPNLVHKYNLSTDGKTLSLSIKEGLKWHDNNPITGKDVVFSLDTIKNTENSIYKYALNNVKSYSSEGNNVTIKYEAPYGFFANTLCFPVIPRHYYKNLKEDSPENMHPIGSASFRMKNYQLAHKLVLQKTTSFKGTPNIDTISILITSDKDTDIHAFNRKVINSVYIDPSNIPDIENNSNNMITNVTSNNFEYLGFNFDKNIFKNVNLRKAIASIIPKDEIIQNIYLGNSIKTLSPINPTSFLESNSAIEPYEFNISSALSHISKAGLTSETSNINLLVNQENKERIDIAELIQKNASNIGLSINIIKKPFEQYLLALENSDFDLFLGGIDFGILPNFSSFLTSNGTGKDGLNYQNFRDNRTDILISNMYNAPSKDALLKATTTFQQYFSEQLPVVGILFKDKLLFTNSGVDGDKLPNFYNQFNNIENWNIS